MIEINGYPVYGKDSSPQITSTFFGLIGTGIFIIIFIIAMIFIRPAEKRPKYKEVQIVLDTSAVPVPDDVPVPVEKTETVPEKVQINNNEEKKEQKIDVKEVETEQKTVTKKPQNIKTKTHKTETPKVQPKKVEPKKEVIEEPVEYALDPMEAFAQQTAKAPKKEFDWDSGFGDESTVSNSSSSSDKVISGGNSFSGSAGKAASDDSQKITSSAINNSKNNYESSGSTASESLANIRNTKFVSTDVAGVASNTTVKSGKSADGKVYIEMTDGRPRALLKPSSPKISLSEEAASKIDSSRTVTISFRVLAQGNVSEITITPAASLPPIVQEEIKNQLNKWIFESADYDGTAKFEYNIVKK